MVMVAMPSCPRLALHIATASSLLIFSLLACCVSISGMPATKNAITNFTSSGVAATNSSASKLVLGRRGYGGHSLGHWRGGSSSSSSGSHSHHRSNSSSGSHENGPVFSGCVQPPLTASIVLALDPFQSSLFYFGEYAAGTCGCSLPYAQQLFFPGLNTLPDTTISSPYIPSYSPYTVGFLSCWNAEPFVSNYTNFCACDPSDNCYTLRPHTGKFIELALYSYCDSEGCFIYLYIWCEFGSSTNLVNVQGSKSVVQTCATGTQPLSSNSTDYTKVTYASCGGCPTALPVTCLGLIDPGYSTDEGGAANKSALQSPEKCVITTDSGPFPWRCSWYDNQYFDKEVLDQGACPICVSMAVTSHLELIFSIAREEKKLFDHQGMLDCVNKHVSSLRDALLNIQHYLVAGGQLPARGEYGRDFDGAVHPCIPFKAEPRSRSFKVIEPPYSTLQTIRDYMIDTPLIVTLAISDRFKLYQGKEEVFEPLPGDVTVAFHVVQVVEIRQVGPLTNQAYDIKIKNTWGKNWGQGGYAWLRFRAYTVDLMGLSGSIERTYNVHDLPEPSHHHYQSEAEGEIVPASQEAD